MPTITLPSWIVLFRDRYKVLVSLEPHVKALRTRETTQEYRDLLKDAQHIMKFTMARDSGTVEERLEQVHQPVMEWLFAERKFTQAVQATHTRQNMVETFTTVMDILGALT